MIKKIVIILIVAFQVSSLFGQMKTQSVKSEIGEITVFFTGAEIERQAKINLKKGMNKLIYSGITPKLKKESIYALTEEGVDVVSVNTHKKVIFPDRKKINNLKDSVDNLSKRIEGVQTELNILNKNMRVLDENSNYASYQNPTVDDVVKLTEYYNKKVREIYNAINENTNKLQKMEKIKQKTIARLNQIKATAVKYDGMEIELVLLVKKDISGSKINLKYLVGGAGWTPIYKINVDKLETYIKLGFQAKVINQTGINWKNIKMRFSTSSPEKSQDTPNLNVWNLNFDNKDIKEGRLDEFRTKDITKEEAKRKNKDLAVVDGVKYIETADYGINNIYKTENNYYIPSDSKPYYIDIEEYLLPVTYRYYSVPKVDADAFLIAQITDWEKYNFIEGQTRVWYNGSFVGESYIRPQLAMDTLDISLGRDSKIFVNRVKVKDMDSEKLIGTNKKQTFKYRLTVKNTNSTDVKFTLRDQLPVSQDNDIKVESIDISNAEVDEDTGSLKWKFVMKPGESREFIVAFSVKFPRNKNLRVRGGRQVGSYRSVRFL